MIFPELRG